MPDCFPGSICFLIHFQKNESSVFHSKWIKITGGFIFKKMFHFDSMSVLAFLKISATDNKIYGVNLSSNSVCLEGQINLLVEAEVCLIYGAPCVILHIMNNESQRESAASQLENKQSKQVAKCFSSFLNNKRQL